MLKVVTAIALLVSVAFSFRVTQGIDEAQRAVIKAYNVGAKDKAPYLYSKTRGYKEVASVLASEADDVGSRVFAIRTMNYASKAISAAFSGKEELTPVDTVPKITEEKKDVFQLVDINDIKNRIEFLRENRGVSCSPRELGRAEAFYDALLYELGKEEPNSALILKFYNEVSTESKIAESKLKVAMENELECYTGVRKVVTPPPPVEEKPKEETVAKEEEKKPEEKKEPQIIEEPLKITARIHFDFDKYNIRREYIPILNEVVKTLKENEFIKVRIEGFTDIIGTKEYNEKLARKRAEAVKSYLLENGIPEDKIEVVGFGKERFIASNEDKIGRLTNRRVEFIVIKLQEE
ncbi:outer membrane protein OmpA-like peptidoglycan-associated protein [Hydrogenivirga caldilitoris]|uniref:Outer membrane protein OmpA-like peptidoglycan-associated protein n=1 Tax=Hydrogenivirga caldilitoris TaxID=246264 RepID=A0A497XS90_9AQUI|nr:OmpA family protein [Hydrogenivirga caldilitoris]RLJ71154.1 outer membrane protein OmpA-like peptidoglycan-associated protein [Hydrogenivirga caldilitoris]